MISKLLIDSVDYTNYVDINKAVTIKIAKEKGINNPSNDEFSCTLINYETLETQLLEPNYPLYTAGLVQVYSITNGGAETKVFEGYINKNDLTLSINNKNIGLKAYGKEKYISNNLSNYDITAIYHIRDASKSRERDGGIITGVRYPIGDYNSTSNMVIDMLSDIGYSVGKSIVSPNLITYKYNAVKFGNPDAVKPIAKLRQKDGGRGQILDIVSYIKSSFAAIDLDSESFNTFIKQWGILAGCVFFYDAPTDKILFIKRDYNFNAALGKSTINLDDIILDDDETQKKYNHYYDGILINFDDAKIGIKVIGAGSYEIGLEAPNSSIESTPPYWLLKLDLGNNNYQRHRIGQEPTYGFMLDNGLELNINANIGDYLLPYVPNGELGLEIKQFMIDILSNYDKVINCNKEYSVQISGEYYAPLRVTIGGSLLNIVSVFESETDMIKETTKLNFQYIL